MIARAVILCLAGTMIYATLRYQVFGTSAWSQLPLWTANKAVSFASAILLASAYLTRDRWRACRFGLSGFALAILHGLMSMPLLSPAYYAKLYDGARLSWTGELCMLGGCLAIVLLLAPAITSAPAIRAGMQHTDWLRWQRVGYLALVITAVHVMALGTSAWVEPRTWPGGLPPITLLSTAVLALPLLLKLVRAARTASPDTASAAARQPEMLASARGTSLPHQRPTSN